MADVHAVSEKWSKAALSIHSDSLSPDDIGSELGLTATRSHTKGSQRRVQSWGLWKDSYWGFSSPLGDHRDMANHLVWLLDTLEPKVETLNQLSRSCRIVFFCGFSSDNGQGGFTLESAVLARLAKLGVAFVLDLYPPESEINEKFDADGALCK